MAKGIRVSQLAKELGVKSKEVLDKLKAEGLGDQARNHQSTVSVGLAMTIREWFAGAEGEGATAVETAAPVKAEVRKRVRQATVESDDESADGMTATAVAERPEGADIETDTYSGDMDAFDDEDEFEEDGEPLRASPEPQGADAPDEAAAETADDPQPPAKAIEEQPPAIMVPVAMPTPAPAPTPVQKMPPAAPEAPNFPKAPRVPTPAPAAGDAPADEAQRPAATTRVTNPQTGLPEPTTRPTITLADRQKEIQEKLRRHREQKRAEEPATVPAPQMTRLKPAEISGPKVVRVEAPDHVPTPRKRGERDRPDRPARIPTGPTQKGGGGVRVTTEEEAKKAAASKSLSSRRRGGDGRRGEALEKLREFTDADIIARRDAVNAARVNRSLLDRQMERTAKKGKSFRALSPSQREGPVKITEPITVKSLSGDIGIKSSTIIRTLMKQGVFATINQSLSVEQAETIAMELGMDVEIERLASAEERLEAMFKEIESELGEEDQVQRPPVVTILGHVDHGKTSLLDKIRHTNVTAGEAGGITQHVAAFDVMIERGGQQKQVTFIDTPGHQAFTAMRARGAQVTDIVVLVIDAAQGIQPQTVESINHAKAAGVPIVVALNKIDRPDANPDKVLGELAANDLNPAEWGGDTEVVRTSAMTGQGVDQLLEILDLQAELMELRAAPRTPARGRVIEARMTQGLGPVATVLVQQGTLEVGDEILAGTGYGRVRAMQTAAGQSVKAAGPSMPILVSGFNEVPGAGDAFFVMPDADEAQAVAEERRDENRQEELAVRNRVSLETLFDTVREGKIKTINLILKGDVAGSVETLKATIGEQNTSEVRVKVIHSAVGAVNESDVELAAASDAVIIGFHVGIDESARHLSEARHVQIRTYNVIYEIFDDIKKALSGMLSPEIREVYKGTAEVRATFKASRLGTIAGSYVTDGIVTRNSFVRLLREGTIVLENLTVSSLRRLKDDVRDVKAGLECGINLDGYDDIKEGDKLEFYVRETVARTL